MIELPLITKAEAEEQRPRERFWRSVAQLQNHPELAAAHEEELIPGASERPGGATRRQFLQIMGASMAMAGLTACRRPVEKILPYTRQPEEIIPGMPLYYATGMPLRGVLRPLVVESHEGRPTKVEGNPQHPMSRGATGVFEQASILNLYDPDRSNRVLRDGSGSSWTDFLTYARRISGTTGLRLAILAEPSSSPTIRALRRELLESIPNARWVTYRPEGDHSELIGLQQVAGSPVRPLYRFSNAECIVSLDADFLGPTDLNFVHNTAEFAASRRITSPDDQISRLYVAESDHSLTGGKADHRLRVRSSEIPALANALAAALGVGEAGQGPYQNHPFVTSVVRDLQHAGQNAIVVAGATQPPEVHALAASINAALGATGQTVEYLALEEEDAEEPLASQLQQLVSDMRGGTVDTLLMLGVNPVYDAPAELEFDQAMRRVDESIHLGFHVDETARMARWHIPRSHYLEAWGDGRAYDGTLSIIQPLIAPLYDSKSDPELLNAVINGTDVPGYDLVREQWQEFVSGDFVEGWDRALHDGVLPDTAYAATSFAGGGAAGSQGDSRPAVADDSIEVVFRLSPTLLDGQFANNAWMQELPDPTTKLVWDNVALMSPATAERLEVHQAYHKGYYLVDMVEINVNERTVELPIWIQPGLADGSIHVTLGYGREISTERSPRKARFFDLDHYTDIYAPGALANGVGKNVAPLRSVEFEPVVENVVVRKTGETYKMVTTQEHGSLEGRPIYRQATLNEFRDLPDFAQAAVPSLAEDQPWSEFPELWHESHPARQPAFRDSPYYHNQWGMVIDLNTCTGCSACVVACNSENNVQMVGKDEVSRGREMHWLRIDRYFVSAEDDGDIENPQMVVQPVLCMHCDNAPCESVCPVAATLQSSDGMNQMVYNRCIGTRYCSNNCPYKVRRFNFFNWSRTIPTTVQMAQNPDVTVRFRGVMEKCTYCVQRIRQKQREAKLESRSLEDGEVQTACQQVCPAQAITFGDLNDAGSRVMREKRNALRYEMLAELNTKPRTSYLARVTNPNTELAT